MQKLVDVREALKLKRRAGGSLVMPVVGPHDDDSNRLRFRA